jgi:osmoprotectant transport system permease protein
VDSEGGGVTVWEWLADPANWTGSTGVWTRVVEQLVITMTAVGIAAVIALPIGIVTGHTGRFGMLVTSVANLGRAIPTFGLLLLFASITAIGVGSLAAVLALILFAIPPIVTNANVAITSIDPQVRSAARAMGMSGRQVLWQVELPLGVPLLFAGLRTALVQTTATATLAAFVGGGGLGRYIIDGFALQDQVLVFVGIILVAVLTVGMELALGLVQRGLTPRGVAVARVVG